MEKCPECGTAVELTGNYEVGEIIECYHCGLELEITSLEPVKLSIYEEEEK